MNAGAGAHLDDVVGGADVVVVLVVAPGTVEVDGAVVVGVWSAQSSSPKRPSSA